MSEHVDGSIDSVSYELNERNSGTLQLSSHSPNVFHLNQTVHIFTEHKMGTVLFRFVFVEALYETILSSDICAFAVLVQGVEPAQRQATKTV